MNYTIEEIQKNFEEYFNNRYMERLEELKNFVHSTIFQDSMLIEPQPLALSEFLSAHLQRFTEQTAADCKEILCDQNIVVPEECIEKVKMPYILKYVDHKRFTSIITTVFNLAAGE